MDRLTTRNPDGTIGIGHPLRYYNHEDITRVLDRLAAYEDAEAEGRLVVLPCKVGDTLWVVSETRGVYDVKVRTFFCGNCSHNRGETSPDIQMIRTTSFDVSFNEFGKTVFLTRQEAEAALKGD